MKHLLFILTVLILPISTIAQQTQQSLPHDVRFPQDSVVPYNLSASQLAQTEFEKQLNLAGKHIVSSIIMDGIGIASMAIGTQQKNQETAKIFYVAAGGCAIVGIVFLLNAGFDLKDAAKAHSKIRLIPAGVSIDL